MLSIQGDMTTERTRLIIQAEIEQAIQSGELDRAEAMMQELKNVQETPESQLADWARTLHPDHAIQYAKTDKPGGVQSSIRLTRAELAKIRDIKKQRGLTSKTQTITYLLERGFEFEALTGRTISQNMIRDLRETAKQTVLTDFLRLPAEERESQLSRMDYRALRRKHAQIYEVFTDLQALDERVEIWISEREPNTDSFTR